MAKVNTVLDAMQPISLGEMRDIRLMDRVDSKFVAPASLLLPLIEAMAPCFMVQAVNDARIAPYCTQYLDTPDCKMFTMHQNGKLNRQKVRIRSYIGSGLSFLEVKNKDNKGRTRKKRTPVGFSHLTSIGELSEKRPFLEQNSLFDIGTLMPSLANSFERITFASGRAAERITVDLNLSFLSYKTGSRVALDRLMVVELKQSGRQRSDFRDILSRLQIKSLSFSKYCMGMVLTDSGLKYNRFKSKCRVINKLIN